MRRVLANVLGVLPLDSIQMRFQQLAAALAGLLFTRDWRLEAFGRPQFFKHQVNLSRWTDEPSRWAFTARGVYARQNMFKQCKVLDLCCGDGSYSYLFFSDIAGHIDAVDNDASAIAYASRYRSSSVITYHLLDVVKEPFPSSGYDIVVWNAAICYFTNEEIGVILRKITRGGQKTLQLSGMLPRANGHPDHKTEFAECNSVSALLQQYFGTVSVRAIDEGSLTTFYFQASDPFTGEQVSAAEAGEQSKAAALTN